MSDPDPWIDPEVIVGEPADPRNAERVFRMILPPAKPG
jgi:hypothetical protein